MEWVCSFGLVWSALDEKELESSLSCCFWSLRPVTFFSSSSPDVDAMLMLCYLLSIAIPDASECEAHRSNGKAPRVCMYTGRGKRKPSKTFARYASYMYTYMSYTTL